MILNCHLGSRFVGWVVGMLCPGLLLETLARPTAQSAGLLPLYGPGNPWELAFHLVPWVVLLFAHFQSWVKFTVRNSSKV